MVLLLVEAGGVGKGGARDHEDGGGVSERHFGPLAAFTPRLSPSPSCPPLALCEFSALFLLLSF